MVKSNKDILSTYVVFDTAQARITVGETDVGRALQRDIDDLTALLTAYREGIVKERIETRFGAAPPALFLIMKLP